MAQLCDNLMTAAAPGTRGRERHAGAMNDAPRAVTHADEARFAHITDPIHEDLVAATRAGRSLFLSCDERALLRRESGHRASRRHRRARTRADRGSRPLGDGRRRHPARTMTTSRPPTPNSARASAVLAKGIGSATSPA